MNAHEIIANRLAEHVPKPSHNLLAREIAKDLAAEGFEIVRMRAEHFAGGMKIVVSDKVRIDEIEFHHPHGRVETFKI